MGYFVQERLLILFDGENIEVSPSQFLKARACGLWGDLDHENTADLKTPQTCLTSKPKFAAYSYMLLESCSGIPSQDKTQYDVEIGQCARPEIIPTVPCMAMCRIYVLTFYAVNFYPFVVIL